MSVALIQEVRTAIGFKKQTDLVTPLVAADMVSLRQTNTELIQSQPINENDKDDLGKGVYITRTFPSHWESGGPWNGRQTSQALAMLAAFGIGKRTSKTGTVATGGFVYVFDQPTLATDGLDLPSTTMAVQIRTGGSAITDKALIGCALEEWGINYRLGPGRDNATFTSQWLGTGQNANPSTIVIPDIYDEASLNAGGITALTFLGFNYLTNKRFVNFDFKWKNNIRDGSSRFPGSGAQDNYQLRGRMRRGAPLITLTAQVECDSGSNEEDLLLAQTEGTGVITVEGAQIDGGPEKHSFKIEFARITVEATPIGDSDGIASYNVTYNVMEHPTNGVLKITAITDLDDILTAA